MAKIKMRKALAMTMALALCVGQLAIPALAKGGGGGGHGGRHDGGESGTEYIAVNIGGTEQIIASSSSHTYLANGTYGEPSISIEGNNVTVTVDGKEYSGTIDLNVGEYEMTGYNYNEGASVNSQQSRYDNLIIDVNVKTIIDEDGNEVPYTAPEETQPEETKPEETKPEETKPEETKPEETKPEETKPEETKPEETKPEETKPEETKPEETKPEETKPEETKPEETKPEETKPEETKPEETKPEETKPEETKPEETKPEETKPEETKPEETKPEETKPEETKPEETEPGETIPQETDPNETIPEGTEPEVTDPPVTPPGGGGRARTGGQPPADQGNGDEIIIPDEDVPLANAPSTGDISGLWMILSILSMSGTAALSFKRKK